MSDYSDEEVQQNFKQTIQQELLEDKFSNTFIDLKIALKDKVIERAMPLLQHFDIESWEEIHRNLF